MHKEAGSFQSIKSPWGRVKLRQRAERGTAPGDWLWSVPRRHFPAHLHLKPYLTTLGLNANG